MRFQEFARDRGILVNVCRWPAFVRMVPRSSAAWTR
jgi:hypothetical protein